jgi:hypothetical protein
MTLQRVSISMRVAHLSILRTKISVAWKSVLPPYSASKPFPRHANNTLPYIKILTTNAFTSWILTLTFYRLSMRTLVLTQLKACLAFINLLFKIISGLLLLVLISIPRYLNYSTFLRSTPLHAILPLPFTCIHSVLVVLIFKSLALQKA